MGPEGKEVIVKMLLPFFVRFDKAYTKLNICMYIRTYPRMRGTPLAVVEAIHQRKVTSIISGQIELTIHANGHLPRRRKH